MLSAISAILALSFSALFASAAPTNPQDTAAFHAALQLGLGPGGVNAMSESAICSPSAGTGIHEGDCLAAMPPMPADISFRTADFHAHHPEPNFRLFQIFWYHSCAVLVDSIVPNLPVVRTNHATIRFAVNRLARLCPTLNGLGGVIQAGGLQIAIFNPATMAPGAKQAFDRCLKATTEVDIPPGCSLSDYIALTRAAHGQATG